MASTLLTVSVADWLFIKSHQNELVFKVLIAVETRLSAEYSRASQSQMCQKLADRKHLPKEQLHSTAELVSSGQ